jgi:hypothetical protein
MFVFYIYLWFYKWDARNLEDLCLICVCHISECGKYELYVNLSVAYLRWSFLNHLIDHCPCQQNMLVYLMVIYIFQRIPATIK